MRTSLYVVPAALGIVVALGADPALAASARTFVSGSGNDSNACTALAPCRTFQHAHDQTNVGGEIVALASAGYGTVMITKSITISGIGVEAAITTNAPGSGITVNAGSSDVVVLRNITLIGGSLGNTGIQVNSGQGVTVDGCSIGGFTGDGIAWNPASSSGTSLLVVKDSNVLANGGNGINVTPAPPVVAAAMTATPVPAPSYFVTLANDYVGGNGAASSSNAGVIINTAGLSIGRAVASIVGVTSVANPTGILFQGNSVGPSPTTLGLISDSVIAFNTTGLQALGAAVMDIERNRVTGNGTAIGPSSSPALVNSFGNNAIGLNNSPNSPTSQVPLQ